MSEKTSNPSSSPVGGLSREQRIGIGIGVVALLISCCACIAAWLVIPIPDSINPSKFGVHGSPEKIAKAWTDAIVNVDCEKAQSYFSPTGMANRVTSEFCYPGRVTVIQLNDETSVTELNYGGVEVQFTGEFLVNMPGAGEMRLTRWTVTAEQVSDKWYVASDVFYGTTTANSDQNSGNSGQVSNPWKIYVLEITEEPDKYDSGWKQVKIILGFENISDNFQEFTNKHYSLLRQSVLETEDGYTYDNPDDELGGPHQPYPPHFRFAGYRGGVFSDPQNILRFKIGGSLTPSKLNVPDWQIVDLKDAHPISFPTDDSAEFTQLGQEIKIGDNGIIHIDNIEKTDDGLNVTVTVNNLNKGDNLSLWGEFVTVGDDGVIHWVPESLSSGPGQTNSIEKKISFSNDVSNQHLLLYTDGVLRAIMKVD